MIQEDRAQAQYRKMTETPIPKLVLTLGIPTTISMLVTNIYNMADTFFVGTLGTSASGATGVVFGLMGIIQAFGFMLGHGAGSNISRRLGSREVDKARMYAATSFYASLGAGLLILLFRPLEGRNIQILIFVFDRSTVGKDSFGIALQIQQSLFKGVLSDRTG